MKGAGGRKKLKYSTSRKLNGLIFMLPWLIGFVMFFAVPVKDTVLYSFNKVDVGDSGGIVLTFNGIQNYIDLFRSEVSTESQPLQRVLATENANIITNLPLIVIFSLFLAILANAKFPGRGIVRVIFFLPIVLGLSLIEEWAANSTGRSLIEAATGGMFGTQAVAGILLEYTFLPKSVIQFLSSVLDNIFQLFTKTGVQTLIFLAGLQSIDPALYEVAKMEGANSYDTFWKVTLPLLSNVLLFAVVYTLIDLFLNSSIAEEVYNFAFAKSKIGVGSALSVVYMANVLVVLGIVLLFLKAVNVIDKD
ncbi:MAG: sugar ABC transporter permease [Lachnospiraceae bacterium]|nr:sugar ABC transporter permease [Lachnospiraceae bacterium]